MSPAARAWDALMGAVTPTLTPHHQQNCKFRGQKVFLALVGPARLCGIEGCWHRLGSLCHEDAAGFEVGGVGEAVGAASQDLEQVVGCYL